MTDSEKELKEKIEASEKLLNEQGIWTVPDLQDTLDSLKDPAADKLKSVLKDDIRVSEELKKMGKFVSQLFSPITYIWKMFKSELAAPTVKTAEKEQALSELLKKLSEQASLQSFVAELNKYLNPYLAEHSLRQLSEEAMIDYSYLNKLYNNKLPQHREVGRDLILKLALVLKLSSKDANELLKKAGYFLAGENTRDLIIGHCLDHKAGLDDTNTYLYEKGQKPLKGNNI